MHVVVDGVVVLRNKQLQIATECAEFAVRLPIMSASSSSPISSPSPSVSDEDDISTIRDRNTLKDHELEDEETLEWQAGGDYSSRMEEIIGEDGDSEDEEESFTYPDDEQGGEDKEEEEEEEFVYTGKDADTSHTSYRDRLKDVLDGEEDSDEDELSNSHFVVSDFSLSEIQPRPDVSVTSTSPPPVRLSTICSLVFVSDTLIWAGGLRHECIHIFNTTVSGIIISTAVTFEK